MLHQARCERTSTHANAYVKCVYFDQLTCDNGKSPECQPAYHADEIVELLRLIAVCVSPRFNASSATAVVVKSDRGSKKVVNMVVKARVWG